MSTSLYRSDIRINARLKIIFEDRNGNETERVIATQSVDLNGGDGTVYAFCALRNGYREFRISQIKSCIDMSTGEMIDDIPGWLKSKYEETDDFQVDSFLEAHGAALTALNFVSRADGAMRKAERLAIKKFCFDCGVHRMEILNLIADRVKSYGKDTPANYGKALRLLALRDDTYKLLVFKAAQYMVHSDRTKREAEFNALEKIIKITGLSHIVSQEKTKAAK